MRTEVICLATLVALLAGCDPDPAPEVVTDRIPALANGRGFDVQVYEANGNASTRRAVFGAQDGVAERVVQVVDVMCEQELDLGGRFDLGLEGGTIAPGFMCGVEGVTRQQRLLCRGHFLQTLADTVAPVDFFISGIDGLTNLPPDFGAVAMRIREPEDEAASEGGTLPSFTITPPTVSDAATLSLAATVAFQHGALIGARAVDPDVCEDGSLFGTVPAEREGGVWSDERVPLAFVLASGTSEAVHEMHGCAEAATRYITAAASERMASDRDRRRATSAMFRGRFDSRIEIANVYLGVPLRLMEDVDDRFILDLEGESGARAEQLVCELDEVDDAEARAEDLVREQRLDPRYTDVEVDLGQVEIDLRNTMRADFPDIFDTPDMNAMSDRAFVESLGVEPEHLRSAVGRIRNEMQVFGRPIFVTEMDAMGTPRVAGTSAPVEPPPAAFLVATTAGAASVPHAQVALQKPSETYGMGAITGDPEDTDYAVSSILATTDTVAAAMSVANRRDDMRAWVPGGDRYEDSLSRAMDLRQFARAEVSHRLDVCVGQPSADGATIDVVDVELLGSGDEVERYELWWGEAGLQCATRFQIEGQPCDERLHRIAADPAVEEDGELSGFVSEYLRWVVTLADVPLIAQPRPGDPVFDGLPVGGRIYVTERLSAEAEQGRRRVIGGFSLQPGTETGEFSRCSQLPAGTTANDHVAEAIAPAPNDCTRPAIGCAGVPFDVRLALEDELTEAAEGRDDIESSFFHYLRLARQSADEADRLGQELIQNGLELDLRSEAAADALQDLCGPVVNVGELPGTRHPDVVCSSGADCAGTDLCVAGFCQPGDVAAMVPVEDPDADSLRRCLGDLGELQTVSLGTAPVCFYRRPGGGPPCGCDPSLDGVSCPACPAFDCTTDEYADLVALGWTLDTVDDTLNLVDPEIGGVAAGACDLFARLVARAVPPAGLSRGEFVERQLAQQWVSHAAIASTADNLAFSEGPYGLDGIIRGGRRWASTGTLRVGPSDRWPCAPLDPLDSEQYALLCGGGLTGDRPLRCGRECNTLIERRETNAELQRLIMTIGAMAGGEFNIPHTPRIFQNTFAAGSVGVDLPTGVTSDNQYCLFAGLPDGCLARAVHNPTFGLSLLAEPSTGAIGAIEERYGVFPWHIPDADPVRGIVRSRGTALQLWEADGLIDSSVRSYVRSEVENDDPVDASGYLFGVPYLNFIARAATDDDRDRFTEDSLDEHLRSHTAWYANTNATHGEMMRALELVCLVNSSGGGNSCGSLGDSLPTIETPDDLGRVAARLRCAADALEQSTELLILENVPADVAAQIRDGAIEPTYPGYRGAYGQTVGELRAQLETLPVATRTVASVLRSFSGEVDIARSQLRSEDLGRQLDMWRLAGSLADQAARCASAAGNWQNATGGAAQCAAAAVNTVVAIMSAIIGEDLRGERIAQIGTGVAIRFGERIDQLEQARSQLSQGFARVNALLAQLEQQRSQANRLAARVLWLDDDDTGREYEVNNVMRARQNTARVRYEDSFRNAVQMSYLARRALEQRLAVDMSEMRDDMTLVPAPATWADGLCSMRGIDYAEIRGDGEVDVNDYSGRFIGDYVDQLERFIESYRLDYPFADGDDVAVISMRDDLLGVRRECAIPGYNELLWSSEPAVSGSSDVAGSEGWSTRCAEGERCLAITASDDSPFVTEGEGTPGLDRIQVVRRLGDAVSTTFVNGCPLDSELTGGGCAAADGGARVQDTTLVAGDYLLSWYERLPSPIVLSSAELAVARDLACEAACIDTGTTAAECETACLDNRRAQELCAAVAVTDIPFATSAFVATVSSLDDTGAVLGPISWDTAPAPLEAIGERWINACRYRRVAGRFTVEADGGVRVSFSVPTSDPAGEPVEATMGAPQLERLDPRASLLTVPPRPFFPTGADYTANVGFCEDTTGDLFRSERHWTRGCEFVCPDGFSGSCTPGADERGRLRCYHETSFDISIDDIDRGELIPTGGFALGNFNYRFNTFAVNLVGTGVRDCSTSETPSACYASGYIPYSVRHAGPYEVRNHLGELVEAPLFTGNVEFAKALAAERYLTNPLSAADRGLLTDYSRTEFRGRPLDGAYRLRIYDADGFDWERVEDVQLILNYRYWTRFE